MANPKRAGLQRPSGIFRGAGDPTLNASLQLCFEAPPAVVDPHLVRCQMPSLLQTKLCHHPVNKWTLISFRFFINALS